MRKNYGTVLVGKRAVLVPYRREHVDIYHEWMKSDFLLEMTGSEPLSFEEELEMQESWKNDDTKCTFIILNKADCEQYLSASDADIKEVIELPQSFITNSLSAMCGDVNLFLSEEESDDDSCDDDEDAHDSKEDGANAIESRKQAELDIMVAETSHRGKGIGKESSLMMMMYGAKELGLRKFHVKIKEENEASISLFKNSLGFKEHNYAACFKEYEYVFQKKDSESLHRELMEKFDIVIQTLQIPIPKE